MSERVGFLPDTSFLVPSEKKGLVIQRPDDLSAFEFVVLSGLRAAQLMKGCTARVDGTHKVIVTAQIEVAAGKVVRAPNVSPAAIG